MAARDIIQAAGGSAATSAAVYVEDVFSTYLYTGTGASQTITNGIDLATKGGLVWAKGRNSSNSFNALYDTARGANKALSSNSTFASQNGSSSDGLTAFNTNGFSLGGLWVDENMYNQPTVSWTFAKQAKFFDVVTWTGDGVAGRSISHSLGTNPGMVIIKRTNSSSDWFVYHFSAGVGNTLLLNSTSEANTSAIFNNGVISSLGTTSIVLDDYGGGMANINASGGTYVAYIFAKSNAGGFGSAGTDSVVACGSFTKTASWPSSSVVNLGWEPQFILYKRTDAAENWNIGDVMRGDGNWGGIGAGLSPNLSSAETTTLQFSATPTGFTIGNATTIGGTYIYLAIRRGPMKTPTDATKVFKPVATSASAGTVITTGFPVDTQIAKYRDVTYANLVMDRLRGVSTSGTTSLPYLKTTATDAEANLSATRDFDNNGFTIPATFSGSSNIFYNFRRAPGFFDVVCYTGNDGNPQTVSHNLTVVPEMVIGKARSGTSNWYVYHSGIGNTKSLRLQVTGAAIGPDSGYWGNTTPTATNIYPGNTQTVGGTTYVAYLFATCPGVSKVFNFTGNGSSQTINCGFASGARFVLIKRTDATGDWWVYDSARGIVSAADPALALNSTAAEVTSADAIDPDSSGFIVNQETTCNVNVNNATYIGLAIA